jgi:hypothetical protein
VLIGYGRYLAGREGAADSAAPARATVVSSLHEAKR